MLTLPALSASMLKIIVGLTLFAPKAGFSVLLSGIGEAICPSRPRAEISSDPELGRIVIRKTVSGRI
jgi:hypothetical protein